MVTTLAQEFARSTIVGIDNDWSDWRYDRILIELRAEVYLDLSRMLNDDYLLSLSHSRILSRRSLNFRSTFT